MNIKYYNEILGKKATMDIEYGSPLKAEMIEGKEISLREVTEADIGLLYEWINDPVCRKNSYNSHIITLEEHKDWFYRKLHAEDCKMFIACMGDTNIGQIRMDYINGNAEISYSISREQRGKGYGRKLIELAENWTRLYYGKDCNIIGKVKNSNIASIKCFEKSGYVSEQKDGYVQFTKAISV